MNQPIPLKTEFDLTVSYNPVNHLLIYFDLVCFLAFIFLLLNFSKGFYQGNFYLQHISPYLRILLVFELIGFCFVLFQLDSKQFMRLIVP